MGWRKITGFVAVAALVWSNCADGEELLHYRLKRGDSVEGNLERKENFSKTKSPPGQFIASVKKSNELTVEVWAKTAKLNQSGPARVVTLSKNPNERNFTLGQDGSAWDFRLRTTKTSRNGLPSVSTGKNTVNTELSHIVFSREKSGKSRIFVNGKKLVEKRVQGDFSNWDGRYHIAIGNEVSGDRSWQGSVVRVSLYDRSLSEREVIEHFQAGAKAKRSTPADESKGLSANETLFSDHIAPLLTNHCLECHDSSTRKGDLDLSSGEAAFAAVDPEEIFESVQDDEMPKKRPPLSATEKEVLAKWIKGGADWAIKEKLDPANYVYHGRGTGKVLRRLTVGEYIDTVKSTLDVDIEKEARELLPEDLRADGFRNTAYNLTVDFQHIESYSKLAAKIVEKVDIPSFAKRFSKKRNVNDKDMRALIGSMGEWVLRAEIDRDEVDVYRGITTTVVSAGGGFDESVSYVLEAMLQSPRFIYHIESDSGSLSGDELAARLSYMIWGTSPDSELREAAKNGELFDHDQCVKQVRRMLDHPAARKRALDFASQWLNLGRLKNLKPNSDHFPKWSSTLAEDMRSETLSFYEDVVWNRKQPMTNLLNAKTTWLTPELAAHYGITYRGKGGLERHDLSAYPERGGLLTQGSVLTIGGDEASMVTRGLFVLNDILRSIVKDPPPCVDTTPVSTSAGLTQRSIAEDRIANKSCGGCHSKFEPLAFGLEKFDGLGSFHHKDHHGNPLREDGKILFPGEAEAVSYKTSSELMNLLAGSDRAQETIAWKLTQFSIGRPIRSDDLPTMQQIVSRSKKAGGTWHALIEAIAMSDVIQSK
ncbi:MAG: DUF1592 domain-containing protein [Verrucomicrobiales bacterium]|nr:DUF1592 domain-containing protein [Verrucomicrobiales bacterium]